MLVYLCDRCGDEVPKESRRGYKGGELICGRCSGQRTEFTCDLCHAPFSIDDLRIGKATIIPQTSQSSGAILCGKCGVGKTAGNTHELRYFLALFAMCLAIPLIVGAFLHFSRQKTVAPSDDRSLLPLAREIEKLNESIDRLKKRQNKPRPEKFVGPGANAKKKVPGSLNPKKQRAVDYLYLEKLVSSISQKSADSATFILKNGTPREKIEAVLKIASAREQAAIPFLERALKDECPLVRSLSARTLGSLGSQHSVGKLMATLGDPENTVRNSASRALSNLTGEAFIFYDDVSPEKWRQLRKIKERRAENSKSKNSR